MLLLHEEEPRALLFTVHMLRPDDKACTSGTLAVAMVEGNTGQEDEGVCTGYWSLARTCMHHFLQHFIPQASPRLHFRVGVGAQTHPMPGCAESGFLRKAQLISWEYQTPSFYSKSPGTEPGV